MIRWHGTLEVIGSSHSAGNGWDALRRVRRCMSRRLFCCLCERALRLFPVSFSCFTFVPSPLNRRLPNLLLAGTRYRTLGGSGQAKTQAAKPGSFFNQQNVESLFPFMARFFTLQSMRRRIFPFTAREEKNLLAVATSRRYFWGGLHVRQDPPDSWSNNYHPGTLEH